MTGKTRLFLHASAVIFVLMAISAIQGCKTPAPTQQAPMKKYHYTDAMSNTFVFGADSLQYLPIKPELSSSGVADGGSPKSTALSKTQFEALDLLAKQALEDVASHIPNRNMGCGTLTLVDATGEKTVFIAAKAATKAELEAALKDALK